MKNNSVTIVRNGSNHQINITMDGQVTTLDASHFTRHHYKLLTNELWRWKESGYIGYPDLSIGK